MDRNNQKNSKIAKLYVIGNIFLVLMGLCHISAGIYVCIDAGSFSWYDSSFAGQGLILFVTSIIGYKTRFSSEMQSCYLSTILILLVIQCSFTMGILGYSRYSGFIGKQDSMILSCSLLSSILIIVCCLIVGFIYRTNLAREEPLMHGFNVKSTMQSSQKYSLKSLYSDFSSPNESIIY